MKNGHLIACAICFFVFGFSSSIIGPTIEDIAQGIGVSLVIVGLLRSGRQFGQAIGYFKFGKSADQTDLRTIATCGAILKAFGLASMSVGSMVVMLAASVFWGLGHSIFNLAPNVVVGRALGKDAHSTLILLHGVYGVGSIVGPLVVELLRPYGFQSIYLFTSVLVLRALNQLNVSQPRQQSAPAPNYQNGRPWPARRRLRLDER